MKNLLLFAFFVLSFSSQVTTPVRAADPKAVQTYSKGYRYPQDGWTILHIEGEPYDRGFQHGWLMQNEIVGYIKSLSAQQSKTAPDDGWKLTRTLVNATFLRKFDREFLEEMKGIADGATANGARIAGRGLDLIDIVTMNMNPEYDTLDSALYALPTGLEGFTGRKPQAMPKPPADHCSAFCATGPATADGKVVIGHITMWSLYSTNFYNVWLDIKPSKGHRIHMQSFPGGIHSGMDYYMNSAGLAIVETTIRQTRFNPDGLPLANRIRKTMQYASTIDEAVTILKEKNNGLYANEWMMADANTNEIALLELGTTATRLRRSSKNEWLSGGKPGFYWGCNNTKDLAVRLDTYSTLNDRPQNIAWRPSDRDRAWISLLNRHYGKIDAAFGQLAFTTPPLAAHPSLDAKVTTAALMKEMKSVALFGPPLGHTWAPTFEQKTEYPDIRALVSNDWTVIGPATPFVDKSAHAVDWKDVETPAGLPGTDAAWKGTLLPASDADVWLTAAFAEYERIVALEFALRGDDKVRASNEVDRALFHYQSDYLTAKIARPEWAVNKTTPTAEQKELDRARWHKEQVGSGVLFLHKLREQIGEPTFTNSMVALGKAKAGQETKVQNLVESFPASQRDRVTQLLAEWEKSPAVEVASIYHPTSFLEDLENTVIVYGTVGDKAANKEAARTLQKNIRDNWSNITVEIEPDTAVTDDDLKGNHVLLVGTPRTNAVTKKWATAFPIAFTESTFTVKKSLYANPASAVIAAGTNPMNKRYSVVVIGGLSATSTVGAMGQIMRAPVAPIVVVTPQDKLLPVLPK